MQCNVVKMLSFSCKDYSKVIQQILELLTWLPVETLAHQEGELVGVLAGGGDPHGAGPVVVEVAQLVGQLLDVVRGEAGVVLDHVVGGRVDSALSHTLRHEEEVIPWEDYYSWKLV